jgi:hypothetical protein
VALNDKSLCTRDMALLKTETPKHWRLTADFLPALCSALNTPVPSRFVVQSVQNKLNKLSFLNDLKVIYLTFFVLVRTILSFNDYVLF